MAGGRSTGERGPVGLVVEREMRETLRSRYYRGSLILQVGLVAAAVVIASLLSGGGTEQLKVGTLSGEADAERVAAAAEGFAEEQDLELEAIRFDDRAALEEAVTEGDVDAGLAGRSLLTQPSSDEQVATLLQGAAADVSTAAFLRDEGLSQSQIDRALSPPLLEPVELDEDEGAASAIAFFGGLLLYLALIFTGYGVAAGIVEEKSTRVIELLLAAVKPIQVLVGKLIGVGMLGLLQIVAIAGTGVGLALLLGEIDLPATTLDSVLLIVLFFALGYAFYGCAFAIAGALVSRQEDMQSSTSPLMLALVGGYLLSFPAVEDPSGPLATVLSFVPPIAPLIVPARAAKDALPLGELLLSVALMVAAIVFVAWIGARIYERAALRMGAPMGLREAAGLLRAPAR